MTDLHAALAKVCSTFDKYGIAQEGTRVLLSYDPLGRRHEKRVLAREGLEHRLLRSTRYVWDRDCLSHEIRSAPDGTNTVTDYVFDESSLAPLFMRKGGSDWVALSLTPIGAVDMLVDSAGRANHLSDERPWGATEPSASPVRHPGQYFDEDLGLYYNRFR
jgi:uncharacterized protein RhaS with RHS repeats